FSATMPQDIRDLANTILRNPTTVQVAPVSATADQIEQSVYFVDKNRKPLLLRHLLSHIATGRTLVFTRTKHGADRVARQLCKDGIHAEAIHGNKAQNARQRALANFKSDKPPVLVATDLASRGIDVDNIEHVVNYDLPNVPETYVHRIGRTGRAGATGEAVSFCDAEERSFLRAIERLTRKSIRVRTDHPDGAPQAAGATQRREHAPSHERSHSRERSPSREHAPARRTQHHEESRPAAHRSHAAPHSRAAQHSSRDSAAPRREGTGSHREGATSGGSHRQAAAPQRQHAAPHRDAAPPHRQSGPAQHRPAAKHSSAATHHRSSTPAHKPQAGAQPAPAHRPAGATHGPRTVTARHPLYGASHAPARPAGKVSSHAQPVGKGVIRHPKAMKPAGR
ncbi:MAG: box helicase, partial [Phycisphaerales bacterium]|nr:box helicase [Phycisphaerales bacterium]